MERMSVLLRLFPFLTIQDRPYKFLFQYPTNNDERCFFDGFTLNLIANI